MVPFLIGIILGVAVGMIAIPLPNGMSIKLRPAAGVMINASSLAPEVRQSRTDVPAVTYASIYPVVLIFKILLAQILVQVMRLL